MKGVGYEGRDLEEKVIQKRLPFSAFSFKARPGELLRTRWIESDVQGGCIRRIGRAKL
jgi:hypothetical protein